MTIDADVIKGDDEEPPALFDQFVSGSGPPTAFAVVIDDGAMVRTGVCYRRDQALHLAFKLRKLVRDIEADFDDPGL